MMRPKSIPCPIMCGRCCTEVRFKNGKMYLPLADQDVCDGERCPYLGPSGCRIPRKHHSDGCNGFICSLGLSVILGDISKEEGKAVAKNMRPWLWYPQNEPKIDSWRNDLRMRALDAGVFGKTSYKKEAKKMSGKGLATLVKVSKVSASNFMLGYREGSDRPWVILRRADRREIDEVLWTSMVAYEKERDARSALKAIKKGQ